MTKKNQGRVQLTERDAEERAAQRHLGGDPPARVVVKHAKPQRERPHCHGRVF